MGQVERHGFTIQSSPIGSGGQPTKWRIILQKSSHRSESSEPHVRLTSPGVLHQEDEPPEHLALKACGAYFWESQQTERNIGFTLKVRTQNLMCTGTKVVI